LHVEGLLGDVVVFAFDDLAETANGVLEDDVLALTAGELGGDVERLREEALDFAGARDSELVFVGELVDAEDGDDVLEILVALEDLLDLSVLSRRIHPQLDSAPPGLASVAGVRMSYGASAWAGYQISESPLAELPWKTSCSPSVP
jgi:hypothetical protein